LSEQLQLASLGSAWADRTSIERRNKIISYFRSVDTAICSSLQSEGIPLLIAGVPYLIPLYRQVNSYEKLAEQHLEASCDCLPDFVLHKLAWQLMRSILTQQRQQQIEEILRIGSGRGYLSDIPTLLPEASRTMNTASYC
jgi:hypothetical protein